MTPANFRETNALAKGNEGSDVESGSEPDDGTELFTDQS